MVLKIFIQTVRITLQQKKMMSLLWAASFIFALPGFWIIHRSFNSYFGGRNVANEWLSQFTLNYLFEMINDFPTLLRTTNALYSGSTVLFLMVTIFLTGGVIGRLLQGGSENGSGEENFAPSFFRFSGKYFLRFFRVFLWTLLLSVVSLAFMTIGDYAGIISACLIAVWIMTSDITKIRLVSENSEKVTKTYFSSFVWILKNFPSVASVYFMNFILLVIGFSVYKILDNALTPDGALKIFLMLFLQQMFVFFRGAIRIQIFGSAILLWKTKLKKVEAVISNPPEISTDEQTQLA